MASRSRRRPHARRSSSAPAREARGVPATADRDAPLPLARTLPPRRPRPLGALARPDPRGAPSLGPRVQSAALDRDAGEVRHRLDEALLEGLRRAWLGVVHRERAEDLAVGGADRLGPAGPDVRAPRVLE